MSAGQIAPAEQVCYVHCNFCNTVLAVSVPGDNMLSIVTVRCGHCTNLLSVNLRGLLHPSVPPATQDQHLQENVSKLHSFNGLFRDHQGGGVDHPDQFGGSSSSSSSSLSSSSKFRLPMMMFSQQNDLLQEQTLHTRPPEKRQRVPSAYNRFIKEEIRRIKANNPEISHREAFSTAAKNWAHYPNIHFGLSPGRDGSTKKLAADVDTPPAPKKIHASFCS